jgi:hypothetical protein
MREVHEVVDQELIPAANVKIIAASPFRLAESELLVGRQQGSIAALGIPHPNPTKRSSFFNAVSWLMKSRAGTL